MRIDRTKATNSTAPTTAPVAPAPPARLRSATAAHGTPHLYRNRHGTYYFRVRIHGSEYKRSLGTKDPVAASMLASRLNYRLGMTHKDDSELIADILAKAEAKKLRKFDYVLPDGSRLEKLETENDVKNAVKFLRDMNVESIGIIEPEMREELARRAAARAAEQVQAPPPPPLPPSTPKLLTAIEPYLTLMGHDEENEAKTIREKRATYQRFAKVVGDLEVGQITEDHALKFKLQLVAEKLSTVRMNKLLSYMRHFLAHAVGHIPGVKSNAFANVTASTKKKTKQRRKEKGTSYKIFTRKELEQMFEPSAYKTYCFRKQHYYWIPLLCLCSGARPEEIASLPLDAVMVVDGIDVLDITKAKTIQSIRKIPLHRAVLDNGFLDYVNGLRERGETQLFPALDKDGLNGAIKNVSRRFNQDHLNKIGITDPRKRLYSFRTTFITQLTAKNQHPALIMAIVGHYEQDDLDLTMPHFASYQGPQTLDVLRDVVNVFDPMVSLKDLHL